MIAKVAVLCAILVAVQASGIILHPPAFVSTGISRTSRQQDDQGNYAFSYDIVDGKGASNSRSEVGDAYGNKRGSYSLQDTDGRARHVDYIADDSGFRANVKTNEPGTAFSAPAGAVIDSPYAGPVAPVDTQETPVAVPPAEPVAVAPVEPVAVTPLKPLAVAPVKPVAVAPLQPIAITRGEPVAFPVVSPVAVAPVALAPGPIINTGFLGIRRLTHGKGTVYGHGLNIVHGKGFITRNLIQPVH